MYKSFTSKAIFCVCGVEMKRSETGETSVLVQNAELDKNKRKKKR